VDLSEQLVLLCRYVILAHSVVILSGLLFTGYLSARCVNRKVW